ncbi:MAG: histidine kinase [Clostridia bacterium]|nr:histidine kinase [Clostridia bacterium]
MKKHVTRFLQFLTRFLGHITLKIWLSSAAVGLAAILFVFISSQLFFNNYFRDNALNHHRQTTFSAAEATDVSMDDIVNRMISICVSTSDFRYMMQRVRNDGTVVDRQLNNDLQEHLRDLSECHPLVLSAMLTSRSGHVYYPVVRSMVSPLPDYTLGYEASAIRRITTLPVQRSPFIADGSVMPLAVPFSFYAGDMLLNFADTAGEADAILYLFLDVETLNTTLSLYNDVGVTLLLDTEGRVLNYPSGSPEAQLAESCGLAQAVSGWDGTADSVRLGNWYALPRRVGQHSLYLVHLVAYADLIAPQREIGQMLVLVAMVAIIVISIASLFTAVYLAKPMQRLNHAVQAIGEGSYNSGMVLNQQDEIGELSRSVDSMYRTIQAQIAQISDERQAKYNAEIRLYAEQINPHFLYNALEYINLEVYNHHAENASMMIQALGDFLRIGLSFGHELIPLEREVEHVQAYIAIMNHRFRHEIGFTTDVPEELLQQRVVKIILQPLVENSVRHGFLLEGSDAFIEIPTISLRGSVTDGVMSLSVIDNGVGFDVEHARRIMHEDPSTQKHVGLSNVYHRLKLYYGEGADIELQSIPYYKNTVTIRIPLKDAAERSKV